MDLRSFFTHLLSTDNETLIQELNVCANVQEHQKGDILVRAGENVSKVNFLLTGVYRGFFLDANGRDITDCFAYKPGSALISSTELDLPAVISIQAVSSGSTISVSKDVVRSLLQRYPEAGQLYIRMLSELAQEHWKIKNAIYKYTALQRYQWFQNNYPALLHKVSNRHIASYLNITPVTLSRIRANLRNHGQRTTRDDEGEGSIEHTDKNQGLHLEGAAKSQLW